jgi:CysZ protein
MLKEIIISIQAYFQAHRFIMKHRLWKWILIPGIIYTTLLVLGLYYFWSSCNQAMTWVFDQVSLKSWLEKFEASWMGFFIIMGYVFAQLLLFFSSFSLFKHFMLMLNAPIFAYLSEKTQSILDGSNFKLHPAQLIKDVQRSIIQSMRNIAWQLIYLVALFILAAVPFAGWITPMIFVFIDCYYTGFSMIDYTNERDALSRSASIDLINHHRGLAIGNGMSFYLFHAVPLGVLFAPGYAVVAATISIHQAKENDVINS